MIDINRSPDTTRLPLGSRSSPPSPSLAAAAAALPSDHNVGGARRARCHHASAVRRREVARTVAVRVADVGCAGSHATAINLVAGRAECGRFTYGRGAVAAAILASFKEAALSR